MNRTETRLQKIRDDDIRTEAESAMRMYPGRLREIRMAQGYTLREVAMDTGLEYQALAAYETGEYYPNFCGIVILSAYYGVSVDWLMGNDWA